MSRTSVFFDKAKNQLYRYISLRNLTLAVIAVGVILRLTQYSLNRSLWLDECFISFNIIHKSFSQLMVPLAYAQVAPVGFLFIEKALVSLIGNNEYVLRLFPLVAGIVSLFLLYYVARRCLREESALIAVGLFALSGHLIYYSSEVKQYSSDATMTLLLLAITIYMMSKKFTNKSMALFILTGGIAVWFSLPSVFVLAGIGCTLSVFSIAGKEWRTNNKLLISYFIWLLSFSVLYLIYLPKVSHTLDLQQSYWSYKFMPFPPKSIADLKWYGKTFFDAFKSPVRLALPGLGALTFLLGAVSIFTRDKQLFFILILPLVFVLSASALHLYPFEGRLITFLVPYILLFIGESVTFLSDSLRDNSRVIKIILIGLLFYGPLTAAASHTIKKTGYEVMPNEDMRSVMKYVKAHRRKDDVLYLYFFSQFPFRYYSKRFGLGNVDYIKGVYGIHDSNKYLDDIKKLRGNKRVWLIFSHTYKADGTNDETFYLNNLDRIGTRLDRFKSEGAAVYLYDLSKRQEKNSSNRIMSRLHPDRQPQKPPPVLDLSR